jgi:hypothetical protein
MFIFFYIRTDKKRRINKISTYTGFVKDQKRGPLNPIGGKPGGGARNGRPPIGAKGRVFRINQ